MTDGELLTAILAELQQINSRLGTLEARSHAPGNCEPLLGVQAETRRLSLREARQGGIFAVIGVALGLVGAVIGGSIVALISRTGK